MVNLDKWEEIEYADIKQGDKVRIITKQGKLINDVRCVASFVGRSGWNSPDHILFLISPDDFMPLAGGSRKIYRRKPKRKVITTFPENLGAVIEGINRINSEEKRFVWDGKDWSDGFNNFVKHYELKEGWHSFVLLSEGVK